MFKSFLIPALQTLMQQVLQGVPGDRALHDFVCAHHLNSCRRKELAQSFFQLLRQYWRLNSLDDSDIEKFVNTDAELSLDHFLHPDVQALFLQSFPSFKIARHELGILQKEAYTDIRINAFASFSPCDVVRTLCADNFFVEDLPFSLGYRLKKRQALCHHALYRQGAFEIQDFASQCLSKLCVTDAKISSVLDYCAGGGGKSLALLNNLLLKNLNHFVLSDVYESKLMAARRRFQRIRIGHDRSFLKQNDSLFSFQKCQDVSGLFDLVMVDAPCTGSGTLRRNPWFAVMLTAQKILQSAALQKDILKKAASFVKPSGRLVYMTCSLFKHENEDVINSFLDFHSEFYPVPVGDIWRSAFFMEMPKNFCFDPYFLHFLPSVYFSDGFFMAILKRR